MPVLGQRVASSCWLQDRAAYGALFRKLLLRVLPNGKQRAAELILVTFTGFPAVKWPLIRSYVAAAWEVFEQQEGTGWRAALWAGDTAGLPLGLLHAEVGMCLGTATCFHLWSCFLE